ncbi:hypothetical protein [Helicobacter burdigaliensis]|uniref:hypothetical protein n=1 Tax=Helicobacter burdigaliensis TaxID=2315334 RepID=UPI000EF726C1
MYFRNLYFYPKQKQSLPRPPKRKDKYKQSLRVEEIREIVKVLEEERSLLGAEVNVESILGN